MTQTIRLEMLVYSGTEQETVFISESLKKGLKYESLLIVRHLKTYNIATIFTVFL